MRVPCPHCDGTGFAPLLADKLREIAEKAGFRVSEDGSVNKDAALHILKAADPDGEFSERTLSRWRTEKNGTGPPCFLRNGRQPRYPLVGIAAWLQTGKGG